MVRGKTLILTTSNGTDALLACHQAASVYPAAAVNLSVAAERGREAVEANRPILSNQFSQAPGDFVTYCFLK